MVGVSSLVLHVTQEVMETITSSESGLGPEAGSSGKGTQAWQPELGPQNPSKGRWREQSL